MHQSQLPENHPLRILLDEHDTILKYVGEFSALIAEAKSGINKSQADKLEQLFNRIKESDSHYLREENVLFPYIEKHGIVGPTQVMWAEHDQIRDIKRIIRALFEDDIEYAELLEKLTRPAADLAYLVDAHFAKENQILFNMAFQSFTPDEWEATRTEFDEIGYWEVVPEGVEAGDTNSTGSLADDMISLPSGKLSVVELEAILNKLPIDISFVDANDEVRYFSQTEDPIFVRTVAAIGTNVRNCHPPKSLHMVEQILKDFRAGTRETADFWISFGDKFVYIRYYPVRDKQGNYLGTIEVTQNIKDLQNLSGEHRLMSDEG